MARLQLTSTSFTHGGEIPRECGHENGNNSPPLTISGIPKGTQSLTLIMDDPDAMGAVGKVWVHWILCNFLLGYPMLVSISANIPHDPVHPNLSYSSHCIRIVHNEC